LITGAGSAWVGGHEPYVRARRPADLVGATVTGDTAGGRLDRGEWWTLLKSGEGMDLEITLVS
jgi:hypothetical protein